MNYGSIDLHLIVKEFQPVTVSQAKQNTRQLENMFG
jgi:hypothetical protein